MPVGHIQDRRIGRKITHHHKCRIVCFRSLDVSSRYSADIHPSGRLPVTTVPFLSRTAQVPWLRLSLPVTTPIRRHRTPAGLLPGLQSQRGPRRPRCGPRWATTPPMTAVVSPDRRTTGRVGKNRWLDRPEPWSAILSSRSGHPSPRTSGRLKNHTQTILPTTRAGTSSCSAQESRPWGRPRRPRRRTQAREPKGLLNLVSVRWDPSSPPATIRAFSQTSARCQVSLLGFSGAGQRSIRSTLQERRGNRTQRNQGPKVRVSVARV